MSVVTQIIAESVAKTTTQTFDIDYNNLKSAHFILNISSGAGTAVASSGTVTLAGVLAGDTVTIDGNVYTAVTGAKVNNTEFSIDGTDTADAADLADSIVNDSRATNYTATSDAAVVTVTSTEALPSDGDAITLASSNGTRLAVSGATLSGGVDLDTLTLTFDAYDPASKTWYNLLTGATLSGGVDLDTLTLTFDAYDPASKTWYNLLTGATLSSSGTIVYRIGVGFTGASNLAVNDIIPKKIRIVATKTNAAPMVYSIGVNGVE